jgi:hypothetical protein
MSISTAWLSRFLFLYSNHPSGGMGDLPQRMKEEWEKRHKKSAEVRLAVTRCSAVSMVFPGFQAAFAAKRLGKPTRHFGSKEEVYPSWYVIN